jgi:hypothetical protein
MNLLPFDVNDNSLRESFLTDTLIRSISETDEHALPRWGSMTAQNMLEHLMWTFQCSTGKIVLPCHTPENLLERTRRFLYDDRQTPIDFKNPLLGELPLPYQFSGFAEAKSATRSEVESFLDHYQSDPTVIHIHPIFGPLDGDQWHRAHFKHCYHHLLQFNLIGKPTSI